MRVTFLVTFLFSVLTQSASISESDLVVSQCLKSLLVREGRQNSMQHALWASLQYIKFAQSHMDKDPLQRQNQWREEYRLLEKLHQQAFRTFWLGREDSAQRFDQEAFEYLLLNWIVDFSERQIAAFLLSRSYQQSGEINWQEYEEYKGILNTSLLGDLRGIGAQLDSLSVRVNGTESSFKVYKQFLSLLEKESSSTFR